jgi:hypothetical protein
VFALKSTACAIDRMIFPAAGCSPQAQPQGLRFSRRCTSPPGSLELMQEADDLTEGYIY